MQSRPRWRAESYRKLKERARSGTREGFHVRVQPSERKERKETESRQSVTGESLPFPRPQFLHLRDLQELCLDHQQKGVDVLHTNNN